MNGAAVSLGSLFALPGHAAVHVPNARIHDWVRAAARSHGGQPAVSAIGRAPLSHAALAVLVLDVGQMLLRAGIGRGDVILVALPSGAEALTAFLACAGVAIAFPVSPDESSEAFETLAGILPVRGVIFDAKHCDGTAARLALREGILAIPVVVNVGAPAGAFEMPPLQEARKAALPTAADDAALVVKTAGTTGTPKVIAWSQASIAWSIESTATWMDVTQSDRSLCVMSLTHVHGLMRSTLPVLRRGGCVTCCPGFDATRVPQWLADERTTLMTAVPAMYRGLLAHMRTTGWNAGGLSLRLLVSGSDTLDSRTAAELAERFGVRVQEYYSQTEVAPFVAVSEPARIARDHDSVGAAVPPWQLACFDDRGTRLPPRVEGAVAVRGGLFNPILAGNRAMFVGDWFLTGDRGWIDAAGELHLCGRTDERINRGGEKIAPEDVETALASHPSVREALVFGFADAMLGERVGALVVLTAGAVLNEPEVRSFVARRLTPKMVLDRVAAVD
jgi:acyl-coenzyme A synthetase/AMP-(fatty) acid ligase